MENSSSGSSSPKMNMNIYIALLPQCFVGLIDAISFMIVTPSFIFYILSIGGSKESYGILLSIFSFASFVFKPILGYWCDALHCQFRIPYLFTLLLAAIGGLLYFLASTFAGQPQYALLCIFLGRFMGGIGAANSTLGFTYIASIVSHDHITQASALLSMVRIIGMAIAPGFNMFLSKAHGHVFDIEITPLNCIGLVLFILNVISFVVIYLTLKEPPPRIDDKNEGDNDDDFNDNKKQQGRDWKFWSSLLSIDIIVPLLCTLTMNANFQLLETGLAPASYHALQFTSVEISSIFGFNAIWIFIVLLLSFYLSSSGVSDNVLLLIGLTASTVGYALIYFLWSTHTSVLLFVLPIMIASISFPFMGAPSRSVFTKVIDTKVYLRNHQGTMQAIMSMAASVAGFTAPGLIASYVLRTPKEVETSSDQRELTSYALFAPTFSIISLVGVLYVNYARPIDQRVVTKIDDTVVADELTNLFPKTDTTTTTTITNLNGNEQFPRRRSRRHSVCESVMGISNLSHSIDLDT